MLKLAGRVGGEPVYFLQMVRASAANRAVAATERVLAWCEPADGPLAELQAALAQERGFDRLTPALRGQRAQDAAIYEALAAGKFAGVPLGAPPAPALTARLQAGAERSAAPGVLADLLDHSAALLEAAKRPDPERGRAALAAVAALPNPDFALPGRRDALRTLQTSAEPFRRDAQLRARLACAEVAVACERFRLANGRFPAGLAEIPPAILAEPPADPATGGPLGYDATGEGAAVSSGEKSPPAAPGVVFRLWNPAARRAAPKPGGGP